MLDLNPILQPTLRPDNANLKSLVIRLYLPTITLGSRNRNADARTMNCLRVPALQNPHEMIEAARKFVVDLRKVQTPDSAADEAAGMPVSYSVDLNGRRRLLTNCNCGSYPRRRRTTAWTFYVSHTLTTAVRRLAGPHTFRRRSVIVSKRTRPRCQPTCILANVPSWHSQARTYT